jgi:hypothetical protein
MLICGAIMDQWANGSMDDECQPRVISKNSKTLGFDSGLGNHLFNNFVALHVNKGRARRL